MNIADVRAGFPGLQNQTFLDAACVSLLPLQAEAAMRQLGQELLACPARDASAHHIALDRTAPPARREIARLIGAQPDDIALIESTTQGLQAIAAAVPLRRGDKVLVGATEFLGLAVPWIGRQAQEGFGIETVPCAPIFSEMVVKLRMSEKSTVTSCNCPARALPPPCRSRCTTSLLM